MASINLGVGQTKVFLDYFGRYLETRNTTALTKTKVRDRTYGFETNGNKIRFEIIRHLNAFHEDRIIEKEVQTWEFDFTNLTFEEVDNTNFTI